MREHPQVVRAAVMCFAYVTGYAAAALSLPLWLAYLPLVAFVTVVVFVPPRK
jgi:hypothetical protein